MLLLALRLHLYVLVIKGKFATFYVDISVEGKCSSKLFSDTSDTSDVIGVKEDYRSAAPKKQDSFSLLLLCSVGVDVRSSNVMDPGASMHCQHSFASKRTLLSLSL